ncbi:MAG: M1 family metallopeptidase [Chitinophagaceae bacterium]|nr:M1 family metallopeptidase [Chitinophagaceae bacterium]
MKPLCLFAFSTLLLLMIENCLAQKMALPIPRNVQPAYESGTRSMDGKPGSHYWQNRGNYTMKINFDPATRLLSGTETIVYYNNSPDTLHQIVIHLYPNLFKKGMQRNYPFDEADENEGVTIESLVMGTEKFATLTDKRIHFSGTNMKVTPEESVKPGKSITMQISWHYTVNKGSHIRTGMVDASSYFLAYTFPRIAVYDDIDGWDDWDYIGLQEFYNDFGNFDAEITVPGGFVVWATGLLQNPKDVFAPRIYNRYQTAQTSDKIIGIIDSTDYDAEPVTAAGAQLSWKFSAEEVTDFAFAISDHYLWQGSSLMVDAATGRRVFVDAAYDKNAVDFFEVADVARKCVDIMSKSYPAVPFPFPHITIFQGLDQMEYPMMVNDNVSDTRMDMVQLTSHEIFHSYFPFYMGTNETKYAWMDEGWATIGESVISPMLGEPEDDGIYMRRRYENVAGTDIEVPLITNTKLTSGITYTTNAYGKPGIFYWTLQNLLGDTVFFKALHEYMSRWHGKHPTPYDFFYSINNASEQDLNWFFIPWFMQSAYPDLALKKVQLEKGKKTSSETWNIIVSNTGALPVPVHLEFVLENDSVIRKDFTAIVWKEGNRDYNVQQALPGKLKYIRMGNEFIPDVNKKDNLWRLR